MMDEKHRGIFSEAKASVGFFQKRRINKLHDELGFLADELRDFEDREEEAFRKLSKLCLDLMNDTDRSEREIHKTAHIISQFMWYPFFSDLKEAFSIAKKLENLSHKISEEEMFGLWDQMAGLFVGFLDS